MTPLRLGGPLSPLSILALPLLALALLAARLPGTHAVQVTSYFNLFFDRSQVQTPHFLRADWARRMVVSWVRQLEVTNWSALRPLYREKKQLTSAITDSAILPPSGDTHDYLSWAVYFWPNCTDVGNATELSPEQIWTTCPYYDRDGVFNPDLNLLNDNHKLANLTDYVYAAALAYAYTGDEQYASGADAAIRTFFVDDATAMNPNLEYAQVLRGPGEQIGRHTGVLDFKCATKIAAGVELLRALNATGWTDDTDAGFMDWVGQMVTWLETSDLAIQERAQLNNHGTYYINQLVSYYVLLGNFTAAQQALEGFYSGIYLGQIAANGDQPLESARTRPYHYRAYNLAALVTNARLADYVGLSPPGWSRRTAANTTLFDALDFAMNQYVPANETDQAHALNPTVAEVASLFGDPTGRYGAYLANSDARYISQPYFALANGLSSSGLHQGLIETTRGVAVAQPTYGV
ncbi:hypothetical protein Q5752_003642 [Cryptotrichosporon argae]